MEYCNSFEETLPMSAVALSIATLPGPSTQRDLLQQPSAKLREVSKLKLDPPAFELRSATLRMHQGILWMNSHPGCESFAQVDSHRKAAQAQPTHAHELFAELQRPGGIALTNVGISVCITVPIEDRRFLLLVRQARPDFCDVVAKPIAGYVNAANARSVPYHELLLRAAITEVQEEIVAWRNNDEAMLIGGEHRNRRETHVLPCEYEQVLHYDRSTRFLCTESKNRPHLPSLVDTEALLIDGVPSNFGLYISQEFQSAQAVAFFDLRLPTLPDGKLDLTLSHCELVKDPDNKPNFMDRYQRDGLLLLELDKAGHPTQQVYQLVGGSLVALVHEQNILLSEAFVPCVRDSLGKQTGIVTEKNIPLRGIQTL
jgi:hypothetical protein